MNPNSLKIGIFASGAGTNALAIIEASKASDSYYSVALIISNNEQPGIRQIAEQNRIPFVYVKMTKDVDLQELTSELMSLLQKYGVDVIALCGFMKLIPTGIVRAFPERILNIHPALLPDYGGKGMFGMNVHMAVINDKKPLSGATVHFVDEIYDHGRALAQIKVQIERHFTPEILSEEVKRAEHIIYPKVLNQVCKIIYAHR